MEMVFKVEEPPVETLAEQDLRAFRRLRDDWSADTSSEIRHSTDEENRFKVRKAWFQSMAGRFGMFIEDYLDPVDDKKFVQELEEFISDYTSSEFKDLERTSPEDIKRGDEILDRVIVFLENL